MARQKKPVTALTVIRRINRVLGVDDQKIVKTRQDPTKYARFYELNSMEEIIKARQNEALEHGCYSLFNCMGVVIKENLCLEEFARNKGVLKPHEYVIDVEVDMDNLLAEGEKLMLAAERRFQRVERLKKRFTSQGLDVPEFLASL